MSFSGTKGYLTKPKPGVMLNPLHPLSRGLVGYWLFNEGSSNIGHDNSKYGNNGTLKNMLPSAQDTGWGGSKFGGGLHFDGSDDYVDYGNDVSLRVQDFTFELWYYAKGSAGPSFCNDNYYTNQGYGMYTSAINSMTLWIGDGAARTTIALTSLDRPLNIWHHLIITKSGSDIVSYWNGHKDQEGTFSGDISYSGSYVFALGRGIRSNATSYSYHGITDLFRIYNRALSAEDVKTLYHDPFCNLLQVPIRRYFDVAPPVGVSPTAVFYGPLVGPLGGPL